MKRMLVLLMLAGSSMALAEAPQVLLPSADPFRALAEIKTRDDIWERSFDSMYEQMRASFSADPKLGAADQRCPGLIDAAAEAAKPVMREGHFRQRDAFRAGLTSLFAQGMTISQAREAWAFYNSPDGRFLLELGTDSTSQQAKIAKGDGPIDRGTFDADLHATQSATIAKLEPEMMDRAQAALDRSTWFIPYKALHPRIQNLRFRISRDPASGGPAGDRIRMIEAVQRATAQYLANCESGSLNPSPAIAEPPPAARTASGH
ncbi:hypothetical protein ACWPMX_03290 [Tsuneonella sp. HG094]